MQRRRNLTIARHESSVTAHLLGESPKALPLVQIDSLVVLLLLEEVCERVEMSVVNHSDVEHLYCCLKVYNLLARLLQSVRVTAYVDNNKFALRMSENGEINFGKNGWLCFAIKSVGWKTKYKPLMIHKKTYKMLASFRLSLDLA